MHAPTTLPAPWIQRSAAWLLLALAVAAPTSVAGFNVICGLLVALSLGALLPVPARRLRRLPTPIVAGVVAVLLTHALANLLTPVPPPRWDVWVEETWLKLLPIVIGVLLVGRPSSVRRALDLLLFTATLVAIYGIVQRYTGIDLTRDRHTDWAADRYMAEGFFAHHLSYGGSLLLTWLLALAQALQHGRHLTRRAVLLWIAVAIMGVTLVFTFTRSAQLGALAGALMLALASRGRARWMAGGLMALGVAVGLALPMIRERFLRILQGEEETRWNLWKTSWEGIQAHPWFGWGQGHFADVLAAHEVEGFYDSRSHAHNDYLMHALNAGLIGLAAQLFLLGAILWVLWRERDRLGADAWIVRAALAGTAGIAVAGFFQVYQTDDEVEVMLYLLVGAAVAVVSSFPPGGQVFRAARDERPPDDDPASDDG